MPQPQSSRFADARSADPRLARLVRLGRGLSFATLVLIVLLLAGGLGLWLNPQWIEGAVVPRIGIAGRKVSLDAFSQTLGLAISAVPLAVLVFGLYQVRLIFKDFGEGRMISETLARRLELFGGAVALQALLNPLVGAALSVALTMGNPPGERLVAVSLSSHDAVSVVVGLLVIGVGAVMREAARMAEENAGFV